MCRNVFRVLVVVVVVAAEIKADGWVTAVKASVQDATSNIQLPSRFLMQEMLFEFFIVDIWWGSR